MKTKAAFFLALALLFSLSFAATAKDFYLDSANLLYTLNPDGTVHVHQEINYYFTSGAFSELYIQLPPDLKISGESGRCAQKQCSFRTQMNEGWRELVLAGSFQSGEQETATFDYTLSGEILAQKDSSQFFYKLWGDQWQKPVGTLTATVEFPGSASETQHFLHPSNLQYETTAQVNSITIVSKNHPAKTYLELNAVMPQSWFSSLPQAKNYMAKQDIINGEAQAAAAEKFRALLSLVLSIALLLAIPLSFAACYFIYGQELPLGSLGYQAIYEREPPGEISPTESSKLILKGSNSDCITAEILNLVQMKCLSLEQSTAKGFLGMGQEKIVSIKFLSKPLPDNAQPHQKAVYDFLKGFAENGQVTSKKLSESSVGRANLPAFQGLEASLNKSFDNGKYLDMKGNNRFALIGIAVLALTFLLLFLNLIGIIAIAIFIGACAFLVFNATQPQYLGRWTPEGRVLEAKWQNFYKFLNDMTLMKEKAPADIILWEKYLIYATAFGISAKVTEAFKVKFPSTSDMNRSSMYSNIYLAGALHSSVSNMSSGFHSTASSGHSGGGFGGGGGGGWRRRRGALNCR